MPIIDQRKDKIDRMRREADAQDEDATHCDAAAKLLESDGTEVIGRKTYYLSLAQELRLRATSIKALAAAKRDNASAIEQRMRL